MIVNAHRERGSTTVLCAVICVVLAGLAWWCCQLGSVVIARHRAEGIADLAALAAAAHAPHGTAASCGKARSLAEAMDARVSSCEFEKWNVRIEIDVSTSGDWSDSIRGHARAGPV